MTKTNYFFLKLLVCLLISGNSLAQTIEYHFSWLGSGTATRTYSFNNVPFEFVITGNPQDVIFNQDQYTYLNLGSPSPYDPKVFSGLVGTYSGFGGAPQTYENPLYVLNREGSAFGGAGFNLLSNQITTTSGLVQMTLQESTDLEWYDLKGPVGPVADSDGSSIINNSFLSNILGRTNPYGAQSFTLSSSTDLMFSALINQQGAIEYHFSWLGSGSAARTYSFNNVPFEAVITGNAQDVIYNQEQFRYLNLGSPSSDKPFSGLMGTVSGFGGAPLPYYEPLYVQNREGSLFAGAGFGHLGDQQNPIALVQMTLQEATDLEWYDLKGPVGPVTDSDGLSDIFYHALGDIVGSPF